MVLFSSIFREFFQTKERLVNHQLDHFKNELKLVETKLGEELEYYLNIVDTSSFEILLENGVDYHRNLEKDGYGIYLYVDDNLKFWSSHKFIIPERQVELGFVKKRNGIYLYNRIERNGISAIGQYLIKKNYRFENSYVTNSFQEELYLGTDWILSDTLIKDGVSVQGTHNDLYLISVGDYTPPVNKYLIIIEILGLIVFGIGIVLFAYQCDVRWKFFAVLPFIFLIRFI